MSSKLLSFIVSVAFLVHTGNSQVIQTGWCDTSDRLAITQFTSMLKTDQLEDEKYAMNAKIQDQYIQSPNVSVLVADYDPYYYWFRFIVENKDTTPRNLMLLMAPIGMKEGKLFKKIEDSVALLAVTGLKYPFTERPYQFTHNVFPLVIRRNSTDTFYLSVDASNVYKSFGFALIKPRDLKLFENKVYFIFGIIVGLLFLFFVLNIVLYYLVKFDVHLWYAAYLAFLFLIVMKNDHLDQQFLHWDNETAYHLTPYMAFGALGLATLMRVVQEFFKDQIQKDSWLYKMAMIIMINAFLSGLGHYLFFFLQANYKILSVVFSWAKYSTLLCIACILFQCVHIISRGFKNGYFILAGQGVFLVGAVQRMFFPSTLSFLFPPTTFHIGIILETVIISSGLIYQYFWSVNKKELQIREDTLKRVSGNLHDNIGQILSLSLLNIRIAQMDSGQIRANNVCQSEIHLKRAIEDLRNMSKLLDPDYIARTDLVKLIDLELNNLRSMDYYTIEYAQVGKPYPLANQDVIFRIFQESINNALKHSNATLLGISLEYAEDYFVMNIYDNGRGFNVDDSLRKQSGGLGLNNLRYHTKIVGGKLDFASKTNEGTRLRLTIPAKGN